MSCKLDAKNRAVILQAIAVVTQAKVGEAVSGKDASYISRFLKDEQRISLTEFMRMLEVCELELLSHVDEHVLLSKPEYDAMKVFVKKYAEQL